MAPANPYARPATDLAIDEPFPAERDVVLASRATRFAARLLDNLLLFFLPMSGIIVSAALDLNYSGETLVALMAAVAIPVWIVQAVLITIRGQSVGKLVTKTRIERLDGRLPGFVRGVLVRDLLVYVVSGIPGVGGIVGLADAVFIFRDDHRCLHDLIADTRVVQLPPAG